MKKFDTKVQLIKYEVLREVAKEAWENTLYDNILDIPKKIIPGNVPTMRCCVYKERAIISERIKIAMGGDRNNDNVIEKKEDKNESLIEELKKMDPLSMSPLEALNYLYELKRKMGVK